MRDRLLPQGSLRHRAYSLLKKEGLGAVLQRAVRLVFLKTSQYLVGVLPRAGRASASASTAITELPAASKADVFCFSVIDWDYRFQRPQQLLSQFAQDGYRVFYLRPRFTGLQNTTVQVRRLASRIYELGLPGDSTLSLPRDDLRNPTLGRAAAVLNDFIRANRIAPRIGLVHHPFWTPLVRSWKQQYSSSVVYDCLDDIGGFEHTPRSMIERESELISMSDLVVATSALLYGRFQQRGQRCALIPNAADYEHFSSLPPASQSPLAGMPGPVIGYFGAIAEWFDVAAVVGAAQQHPAWSFVLIGDASASDQKSLRSLPNIHLLGEKTYAELPAYLTCFDVCTIPFRRIPLTEATNPVKLFEYLSAGKPVVAASLPELQPFKDVVRLYSTVGQFAACLESALQDNDPARVEERRRIAWQNTWKNRYEALEPLIREL